MTAYTALAYRRAIKMQLLVIWTIVS